MRLFIISILSLAFYSCSSPLSDVEISDLNLITPHFSVTYSDTENGGRSSIRACLNDKNFGYIQLKKGAVYINDENTSMQGNCYEANAEVFAEQEYEFIVELADSNTYSSIVTTPRFFEHVEVPNSVYEDETFYIDWDNNYKNKFTNVVFEVKDSSGFWRTIYEKDVKTKTNLSVSGLDYPINHQGKGKITLTREVKGSLNKEFNGGSISATFIYERELEVRD